MMQESTTPVIYRPKGSKLIPLTPLKTKGIPAKVLGGIVLGLGAFFTIPGVILSIVFHPAFLIAPTFFPGLILAGVGAGILRHASKGMTDKLVVAPEGVTIHSEDKRIALNWSQIKRIALSPDGNKFEVTFRKNTYSVDFFRMAAEDKAFLERLIIHFDDTTSTDQF